MSHSEERIGVSRIINRRDMEEFRGFIKDMELVDVSCVGGKFTWYKGNGKAMSRINRFILSRKLIEKWEVYNQVVGKRDISDHNMI